LVNVMFELTPDFEGKLGAPIEDVAQEAVDATASTYAHDASIDVERHLRAQLGSRGVKASNDMWVAEAAREIRSGHRIVVGKPDGSIDPG
jgi:hypothetical protein